MIYAIILSNFCYCVFEVQHAELQMKASKLYYKNTSVTHRMVNGERLLDMLDFVCLGVRVCLTETEWEQQLTLVCVCGLICAQQQHLSKRGCICMRVHVCMFSFACVLLHVCVYESRCCVCALCWMNMHVFVECLRDGGLWLSFGAFVPRLSWGGVWIRISVHSPWQTSIIKHLLSMQFCGTQICACTRPPALLFWSGFKKIWSCPVRFIHSHHLKLNFVAHCWSVILSAPCSHFYFESHQR